MAEQLGWLDTNIFVHALHLGDPHRERCLGILRSLAEGNAEAWIDPVVAAELTYVLPRRSGLRTAVEVRDYLLDVIRLESVHADDKEALIGAVLRWERTHVDFADAWLTALCQQRDMPVCSVNRRDFLSVRNTYRWSGPRSG